MNHIEREPIQLVPPLSGLWLVSQTRQAYEFSFLWISATLTVKSCDWWSDLPALWQQEVRVSLIAAKEVCFTLNWRLSLSLSFSLFKALVALSNSSQIPQSLQLLFSLKFLSLRTITQAMSTCIPSKITRGESLSSCTAIAGQESVRYSSKVMKSLLPSGWWMISPQPPILRNCFLGLFLVPTILGWVF